MRPDLGRIFRWGIRGEPLTSRHLLSKCHTCSYIAARRCNVRGLPLEKHPFKLCRGIKVSVITFHDITGQQLQLVYPLHKHRRNGNQRANAFLVWYFIGNDHGVGKRIAFALQLIAEQAKMDGIPADFMGCDKATLT